ncbi:hypothetical protein [Archangium lansingense]|uniref:ASCH domain-containing protein n=1 Tax=Archangium lansingense TaxID=2995310 RepID=A0ABT4AG76_9BACT|nr:hypothetical protein [Archangium lansinium]MCY1080316.1 hypothetical protein [Archangium lansinium]
MAEPRERPILFSGPMVRALLDGRKTQTRRVVNPHPRLIPSSEGKPIWRLDLRNGFVNSLDETRWPETMTRTFRDQDGTIYPAVCPYGSPGDRLWVRESARVIAWRGFRQCRLSYEADGAETDWLPFPVRLKGGETSLLGRCIANGVFREGARLTLEVTGVRVERLRDISEADARAEGIRSVPRHMDPSGVWWTHDAATCPEPWGRTPEDAFARLWEIINGTESWDANPWVWVVEFRRVEERAP